MATAFDGLILAALLFAVAPLALAVLARVRTISRRLGETMSKAPAGRAAPSQGDDDRL